MESVSRIYAQDFDPLADRYLLHGDPDVVAARLTEYHAAGSATVIFSAACQPERRPAVTGLFAQACFPAWHGTSTMASPSKSLFGYSNSSWLPGFWRTSCEGTVALCRVSLRHARCAGPHDPDV